MAQRFLSPPAGGDSHILTLPGGRFEEWHDHDGDGVINIPHDQGRTEWDPYSSVGPGNWIPASTHGCGSTSGRPAGVPLGGTYIDDDLKLVILFDGRGWRDPVTGKAV